MASRRYRVQERRTTQKAFLLFVASIGLLLVLVFFGIPLLTKFAVFVNDLQGSSTPVEQEDKTPPAPPIIDPTPQYTQKSTITITGISEAGSTLKIFLKDKVVKEIVVDDTSLFSLEVDLAPGKNQIWAIATDSAGNEGAQTPTRVIIYDKEPPVLEIEQPTNGAIFFGSERVVVVKGVTESESSVTINDRLAIVDQDGKFSHQITLSEGENQIVISTVDQAGNETEKTLTVSYSP